MACRLGGAKPLSEPMPNFIQENALENVVCEVASILSRPQCVNGTLTGLSDQMIVVTSALFY